MSIFTSTNLADKIHFKSIKQCIKLLFPKVSCQESNKIILLKLTFDAQQSYNIGKLFLFPLPFPLPSLLFNQKLVQLKGTRTVKTRVLVLRFRFPCGPMVKNSLAGRRRGFDHWVGKIPREGNGNPLQYSCLRNPMDRGAWWATVHGVPKESDMTQQLNNSLSYLRCQHQILSLNAYVCLGTHVRIKDFKI